MPSPGHPTLLATGGMGRVLGVHVPGLCAQCLCPEAPASAVALGEQRPYPPTAPTPSVAATPRSTRTARYSRSCAAAHGGFAVGPSRQSKGGSGETPSPPAMLLVGGRSAVGCHNATADNSPYSAERATGRPMIRADRRQGQPSRTPGASYRPSLSRIDVRSPIRVRGGRIMAMGGSFTGGPYLAHLVLRHARTRGLAPGESNWRDSEGIPHPLAIPEFRIPGMVNARKH